MPRIKNQRYFVRQYKGNTRIIFPIFPTRPLCKLYIVKTLQGNRFRLNMMKIFRIKQFIELHGILPSILENNFHYHLKHFINVKINYPRTERTLKRCHFHVIFTLKNQSNSLYVINRTQITLSYPSPTFSITFHKKPAFI